MKRVLFKRCSVEHNERPFSDIITGSIGIFALIIIILTMFTVINAKITLDIEAPIKNDKYPFFVMCDGQDLNVVCRNTYLPNTRTQNQLLDMCNSLKIAGIQKASSKQRWVILNKFFSSNLFNNDHFYVFSFIRPNAIATFNKLNRMLEDNNVSVGYTPVAKSWNIREALRID